MRDTRAHRRPAPGDDPLTPLTLDDVRLCVDFLEAGAEAALIAFPGGFVRLSKGDLPKLRAFLADDEGTIALPAVFLDADPAAGGAG